MSNKCLAPVEIDSKAVNESGEFEGYASVFGVKDKGGDITTAGAFLDSIGNDPSKIKMLWQHDPSQPIGKWVEMREDERGLYVKGKLLLTLTQGRETHEMMREGLIDGLSIGYRTLSDDYDRETGTRKLLKVDLKEVSCVTFPMNEEATVSLVKGDALPTEREFEKYLTRDAGFSSQQAKAIIAEGYKSLMTARDAGGSDDGLATALRQATARMRSA